MAVSVRAGAFAGPRTEGRCLRSVTGPGGVVIPPPHPRQQARALLVQVRPDVSNNCICAAIVAASVACGNRVDPARSAGGTGVHESPDIPAYTTHRRRVASRRYWESALATSGAAGDGGAEDGTGLEAVHAAVAARGRRRPRCS